MIRWLIILLLLLPVRESSPQLQVQAQDGRVTIAAQEVPLKVVLDRLAQETGVEVVYEGPEPSPLVTVTIEDQPEREALTRILEGLGLNHALQMDASGHRVEMVIIQEPFGSGPATVRTQNSPATGFRRPAPAPRTPGESAPEYEDPDEELLGPDGLPAYAAAAPYDDPSGAAWPDAPQSDWPDAEEPEFPSDASSPVPPGSVPYPRFPGPASYP
jgi:hypothetical protein